jgi:hypothetical protein
MFCMHLQSVLLCCVVVFYGSGLQCIQCKYVPNTSDSHRKVDKHRKNFLLQYCSWLFTESHEQESTQVSDVNFKVSSRRLLENTFRFRPFKSVACTERKKVEHSKVRVDLSTSTFIFSTRLKVDLNSTFFRLSSTFIFFVRFSLSTFIDFSIKSRKVEAQF